MKLYAKPFSCSMTVRMLLEYLKINFEYETVDLETKKTQNGADFLKINPKGKVPTLEINGELLTENVAILQFLADKYEAFAIYPQDLFKRYQISAWLNYVSNDLHAKTFANLLYPIKPKEQNEQDLKEKLEFLNNHYKNQDFSVGDTLTLADFYTVVVLNWLKYPKIARDDVLNNKNLYPNIYKFWHNMLKIDSVKKTFQNELESFKKAQELTSIA